MRTDRKSKRQIVLVLGMPRSGTTWLGKMLDCHPESLYLHEPDSGTVSPNLPIFVQGSWNKEHEDMVREFLKGLSSCAPLRSYVRLPLYRKTYHKECTWLLLKSLAAIEKLHSSLGRKKVPSGFISAPENAPLVIKSVESFGRIPLFLSTDMNIKIIYILRHPCGVRYSLVRGERMGKFKDNKSVTESVPRLSQLVALEGARSRSLSLPVLLGKSAPERFAYWWLISNEKAVGECEKISCAKVVVYEDLCVKPLKVMTEIYEFLDWRLSDQVKIRIQSMTQKNDERYYSVFKNPQLSMNAWTDGLDPEETCQILEILSSSPLNVLWERNSI